VAGLTIEHKREFHLWKWLFWLLVIGFILASSWFAYRWYTTGEEPPLIPIASADPKIDESNVSEGEVLNYTVPASHPRYISVPKLGIDKVRIMKVGVTSSGLLDVPKNIHDTAWYEKSATPGQGYGAVLIDGHNGGISKDGVFAKLSTLTEGDEITIERGDGKKFTYSVVSNESMSLQKANESGMKEMMQSAEFDKEGLSLVTCDGKWVPRLQQFDRRVMLRAVAI
jgi:sortase (surface protein transpeptidase)